jgi:hypothetical protein
MVYLDQKVCHTDDTHNGITDKLYSKGELCMEDIQKYSILSDRDFDTNNSPWYTAPIVVKNNFDRFDLTHAACVRFATANNTHVLRWKSAVCRIEEDSENSMPDEERYVTPGFWEYFVLNAPASLTETIHKGIGLLRGLKCRLYSLTMESEEHHKLVVERIASAPFGSVIDIPCPLTVNVALALGTLTDSQLRVLNDFDISRNVVDSEDSSSTDTTSKRNQTAASISPKSFMANKYKKIKDISILDSAENFLRVPSVQSDEYDALVIPILRKGSYYSVTVPVKTQTSTWLDENISVRRRFQIDLEFVVTPGRIQGRTYDRLILAPSYAGSRFGRFGYEDLYISLTRVRSAQCIRFLLSGDTVLDKWESVRYLTRIKPSGYSRAVLQGWPSTSNEDWVDNRWSPFESRKAYHAFHDGSNAGVTFPPLVDKTNVSRSNLSLLIETLLSMSVVPSDPPRHTRGGTQYGGTIYRKNDVISRLPSRDEVFELASSLKSSAFISFMYGNELRVRHVHEVRAKNVIERRRWEKTFTKKQLDVYRLFQKYIVHPDGIANKPPEITWIVGPAGCGKSQLVRQIVSLCEHENAKCVRVTIRHNDCIGIDVVSRSYSIMRFTGYDVKGYVDITDTVWFNDFRLLMKDAVLLVIDDYFNCRPWQISKLSRACEHATGRHKEPFGGIPTIACGDIRQRRCFLHGNDYLSHVMHMCLNVWTVPFTKEE